MRTIKHANDNKSIFVFVFRLFGERIVTALINGKRRVMYEDQINYVEGKVPPHYPLPCVWIKGCGTDRKRSLMFRRSI